MDGVRGIILMVDDNVATLAAGKALILPRHDVMLASSAMQMFMLLDRARPDVILLDVDMPVMNGYEAIRELKGTRRLADIPVIFLTAMTDEKSELRGFDLGAVDYILKPFFPPVLMKRIENQMTIVKQREAIFRHTENLEETVRRRTEETVILRNAVLDTMSDMVEFRSASTSDHSMHTQMYLQSLIVELRDDPMYADEMAGWDMNILLPSAQLHDVGKVSIPDSILNKPGKLTPDEFEIMKTHVTAGLGIVKRIAVKVPNPSVMDHALRIVGTHHEKWDGSGYPAGLRGEDIPLEGRLMAIADVYDALVSERPYKKPFTHEDAVKTIADAAGSHFDPSLADIFLRLEGEFEVIAGKIGGARRTPCGRDVEVISIQAGMRH